MLASLKDRKILLCIYIYISLAETPCGCAASEALTYSTALSECCTKPIPDPRRREKKKNAAENPAPAFLGVVKK